MSGTPRVSVLIASRDGERFLDESLASLAGQTLEDLEIIAVDDGSRDGTRAKLEAFAARHGRTRVLEGGGRGLAAALDLAARAARASYLARQDDDDLSLPERLSRQADFLDRNPEVAVVGTAADVIDERGTVTGRHPVPFGAAIRRTLHRAPPFVHGSVMLRADAYRAAGGYRAAFGASQDFDLWLRLPERAVFANLETPLYQWRHHPRGVFSRARDQQLRFAALARALADERRERGRDSLEAFEQAGSFERFVETWERGDRLALRLGEVYVRDRRPAGARPWLAHALASPRTRPAALAWALVARLVALAPGAEARP